MTVIAGPAPEAPPRTVGVRARRLGIDTGQEAVAYFRDDSPVVRAEGFDCATRVWVRCGGQETLATVNVVSGLLSADEVGLSDSAWRRLRRRTGDHGHQHTPPGDASG